MIKGGSSIFAEEVEESPEELDAINGQDGDVRQHHKSLSLLCGFLCWRVIDVEIVFRESISALTCKVLRDNLDLVDVL